VDGLAKALLKVVSQPATLGIAVFGLLGLGGLVLWAISIAAQSDKTVDITLTGIHVKADKELLEAVARADRCEDERADVAIQASRVAALIGQQ